MLYNIYIAHSVYILCNVQNDNVRIMYIEWIVYIEDLAYLVYTVYSVSSLWIVFNVHAVSNVYNVRNVDNPWIALIADFTHCNNVQNDAM